MKHFDCVTHLVGKFVVLYSLYSFLAKQLYHCHVTLSAYGRDDIYVIVNN